MPKPIKESGIIKIDITEPSSRLKKVERKIMLAGVQWIFSASLPESRQEPDIVFALTCNETSESTLWSYEVEGQFTMQNHLFPEVSFRKTVRQTFTSNTKYVEFFMTHKLSELVNPDNGFTTKPGNWFAGIFMEANLQVTGYPGVRRLRDEDFRVPRCNLREAVLLVNDEKLYVCKQAMAMMSRYFYEEFYPKNGEEKPSDEGIVIEGVKTKQFVEFLKLVHFPGYKIRVEKIAYLLELAKRFESDQMLRRIASDMTHMSEVMLHRQFQYAEKYELIELQEACFAAFKLLTPNDADYVLELLQKHRVSIETNIKLKTIRRQMEGKTGKRTSMISNQDCVEKKKKPEVIEIL